MSPGDPTPSPGRLVAGVALAALAVVGSLALPGDGLAFPAVLAGALAVVVGARGLAARAWEGVDCAETGDVERGATAPTPGATFDRSLETFEDEGAPYLAYPDRVRAAIESAVVEVLGRYRGLPSEAARERIREGTWTDDADATGFLAAGEDRERDRGRDPNRNRVMGWFGRVRRTLGRESGFDRGLRHAVAALGEVSGAETGAPGTLAAAPSAGGSGEASAGDGDGDGSGGENGETVTGTNRWRGIGAAAVLCAGVGVVTGIPAVALAGTVGVGVAAYASGGRSPAVQLAVERRVATTDPAPGERIPVTVTVENVGDRALPDLRVVDGVPPALPVVEGSARTGTVLRPGETATLSYALEAHRGVHEFGPLRAVARDLAGTAECDRRVPAAGESATVTCVPPLLEGHESVPIFGAAAGYAGRVATDAAGEGVEFHAVREYQPSDPLGRIDWNRYARTGQLAAREFREERATTAVVVVDARAAAYLASAPGRQHAVERAVEAARQAFVDLEGEGNRVGIAALGRTECWLAPGTGAAHRARARDALATHPALSPVPPREATEREEPTAWLRSRLPSDAQVVFVSPVCDDGSAAAVRRLRAHGYPVTVVSPDPTAVRSPSEALARVGRRLRLARLRDVGSRVVDWREDEPLAAAVRRGGLR